MKDASITGVVAQLGARLGDGAFVVTDHWEADRCAIGLSAPGDPGRLVYISTSGKPPGRYDVSLELPAAPGADLPYQPAGDRSDLDVETLTSVVGRHLVRRASRPAG
ncbi:MAG: hypothetical protein ACJ8J0_14740 [Longimicrobiaceae bacterium]